MKELLAELLSSKKFVGLVVGLLSTGAVKLGLPEEQSAVLIDAIVKLVGAYLVGQGLSDLGKEKAKVETESAGESPPA